MKKNISSTIILSSGHRAMRHPGDDHWSVYKENSANVLFKWYATPELIKPADIALLGSAVSIYEQGVTAGIGFGKKIKMAEMRIALGITEQINEA